MKRTPLDIDLNYFPAQLHPIIEGAAIYDSSCSPEAKVYYIEKESGLFLKASAKGTLRAEAEMTAYFHRKSLSPEVLSYFSEAQDWLLTRAAPGEDCIEPKYLADPKRLCDTTAELLRWLHDHPYDGCPVPNRTEVYLNTVYQNKARGHYDITLFPPEWGYLSPEEAWAEVNANGKYLHTDTLLHGDYCLPNIILQNWHFSSFIDVGCGGVGDRHIDLFWGVWSLLYNLKTNAYYDRFLDAYGRDQVSPDVFHTIAACEIFG